METIELAGLKLNKDKCVFRQNELHFLGQVVDENGVRADPEKVKAIAELKAPKNMHELKRVLGMINYMGKYIPHLASLRGPLYELLRTKTAWTWDYAQEQAFSQLKEALMLSPVLSFYDAEKPTVVSADASSYGLGGVLLQQNGNCWKPVAYCLRTLTSVERRYAQIEKECLAGVWACEHFSKYLSGMERFKLITDQTPLVPLINSKDLDNVPIRCQRLLLRLMRFSVTAEYAPGKTLVVADTLSRSPQSSTTDSTTESDISCYVNAIMGNVLASQSKINAIRAATKNDENLQRVKQLIRTGWPAHVREVHPSIRDFHAFSSELSETDGLLTRGNRIIIPESLREKF
ncbi:Retrovirus-related Pol polyprotein from transposon opus [Labeo rohita]|uniref:Retrovirus-related Pol polyprotein from transposon opus n=1 Tax=Labeo rohita TaxID=84645 RepID=A0ABQ8MGM5_LABRO|nr:Retrovirus-related Pol polyprotein from transposon opus [Labeo rohita]